MALSEDLDAGGAYIRDGGQRRFQIHDRAVVAHEAVEGNAVAEGAFAAFRRERNFAAGPVHGGLVLQRDVGHAQPQLDGELVDALRQAAIEGNGDHGSFVQGPAHAVAVPELLQGVGPLTESPKRNVRADVDDVAYPNGDAVDEGSGHAPVGRHPDPELKTGHAPALSDIAEADGLDEVSFEKHLCSLSLGANPA